MRNKTPILFSSGKQLRAKTRSKGKDCDCLMHLHCLWAMSRDVLGHLLPPAAKAVQNLGGTGCCRGSLSILPFLSSSKISSLSIMTSYYLWPKHRGLKRSWGKLKGIRAGFTLQSTSQSEYPCYGCLSYARTPCSRNLKKNCWPFFPNQLALFCGTPLPWHKNSIHLPLMVLWCRHLEWLEALQQMTPCLLCSVNKT